MNKNEKALVDKKEYWEKEWPTVFNRYFWRRRQHMLMVADYLRPSVLDVGCGPGYLAGLTKPNEAHYTGVDISKKAIEHGKMLFPGAKFEVVNALKGLPFGDNQYQTVVACEFLEHIEDYHSVLDEMKRVSRGEVIITVPINLPNPDHVWPEWGWSDIEKEFGEHGDIVEIRRVYEYNFNIIRLR